MTRRLPLFALAAVLASAPAARAADDALESALKKTAPAVIDHLRAKGFKNVGVLKFLVRHGDGPARDDAGDLNRSLANKTEVALCLALKDDSFGILHDPSAVVVAENMTRANHLSEDGRKAFFERKFPLAWSGDKADPSGFLTGTATLTADLTRMTVRFQAFDPSGKVADVPGEFTVATDPEALAEAGFSYTLARAVQKALVSGDPPPAAKLRAAAVGEIVRTSGHKTDATTSNLSQPLADSPVKWVVRYNGKPVAVENGTVPEPAEGDRVTFVLSNPGPGTYAAVLMVNGANTLYEERAAPIACRKWVLPPGAEVEVRGFQVAADRVAPFKVLPPEAAEEDVVRYGDHAGTFRLVVYAGDLSDGTRPAADADTILVRADRDERIISLTRGSARPFGGRPQTLAELQSELRGGAKSAEFGRGYVGKGTAAEESGTETVKFVPVAGVPVADISLRYFTPKK